MERGVYFDAWFPRHRNYHPSHPARRLRMVEDLVDYRATTLIWAALGGGSFALPYLEEEAQQQISSRFRFYGFLNDAEFIAACHQAGIKVFGIVYDVQGWEFPVELTEEEDRILALNEVRGVGKRDWIGLREFSQNRYPKLWPPIERYFPEGLANSDGERVTDLLEEACSRDIHGEPIHADWVESPDMEHFAYQMDRNNPVWREYLKAILRIQIDAGVDGVVFDTPDLPMVSIWYGGCFCRDCLKGFRSHLQNLPERPPELEGEDPDGFDYRTWLLERGFDFKTDRESTPLFGEYLSFQRLAIARYFGELADYARSYAASKGRRVLVSGNFYDLFPHFHALASKCDVLVTETKSRYRQSAWCRYAAGFAGTTPVIVIEDPYDSLIPDLARDLSRGRAYDLFRSTVYEPAALGINMSVPYGAWLGSVVRDAFFAPHDLVIEVQDFLATHDDLFATETYAEVGVIFSVPSELRRLDINRFPMANTTPDGTRSGFWTVTESLSAAGQPYDVVVFPDAESEADDEEPPHDLMRYRTVIIPESLLLTRAQEEAIARYLWSGGLVLADGELKTAHRGDSLDSVLRHPRFVAVEMGRGLELGYLGDGPQVVLEGGHDLAMTVRRLHRGAAIHIIRYAYDEERDEVPVLPSLRFGIRLPRPFFAVSAVSPGGVAEATVTTRGGDHQIEVGDVPLYTILVLR